jgi:hypothetical protein
MPRFARLLMMLGLVGLLSACQTGLPAIGGAATDGVTPNAVTGGEIEVTALDEPTPAVGEASVAEAGVSEASAAPPPAGEDGAKLQSSPVEATPVAEAAPAPQPDLEVVAPETPKTEQQLACEKKKGKWVRKGKGDLWICVFSTKDSGKQCTRESQCEGVCLARSRTCSPLKPLLGCNEILQDNGARVTLCID